jgi:thiol-disulfide isomerase/thioredoxin
MKKILPWVIPVLVAGYFIGQYIYKQPKFINGESIPEFSLNENEKISDLQGNYLLLDFWGSWCGPCISEFDDVRALYEKYKDKKFVDANGFEVIGIAIEDDAARWDRAIQKYNLNWKYQVLDLSSSLRFFNGPIAESYGVREVPTKYLINPEGVIIGVNLPFNEIDKRLTGKLTK